MSTVVVTEQVNKIIKVTTGAPGAPGAIASDAPNDGLPYVRRNGSWDDFAAEVAAEASTVPAADKLVKADANGLISPQFIDPNKIPSLVLDFATGNGKDEKPCATRYQSNGIQKLDGFDNIVTFTRASTGTHYNSTGRLVTAALNEPRFDYDPDALEQKGLLIEESRTNHLVPSNMETHSDLGYTRSHVAGPDGSFQTALRLTEDTGTSQRRLRDTTENPISHSIGETITMSCYVRPSGDRTNIALLLTAGGASTTIVDYNLDTVAVGASNSTVGTISNERIEVLQDGWYRLSFALTLTVSSSEIGGWLFFSNVTNDGNATYIGDGSSYVDAYGMQVETGSFPTSYIPSTETFTSRASTGTYYDASGILQSAAIDVERLTYNPSDLTAPAVQLFEEARTNLALHSEDATNAAWVKSALSVTGNTNTAPDGTLTADKVTIDSAASTAHIRQSFSFSASTIYTLSCFVKPVSGINYICLLGAASSEWDGGQPLGYWNVSTAAFESTSVDTLGTSVLALPNGWYRLSITGKTSAGSTAPTWRIYPSDQASTIWAGSPAGTENFLVWGMQIEEGAYLASYIPTTATAVTRSADVYTSVASTRVQDNASVNTLTPWLDNERGTIVATASNNSDASDSTLYCLDDGSTGQQNQIDVRYVAGGIQFRSRVRSLAVTQTDLNPGTITLGDEVTLGFSYGEGSALSNINGLTAAVDSPVTPIPQGLSRLRLGQRGTGNVSFSGWFKELKYYPYVTTTTELEAITS